ncbi:hypothetical protein RF11_02169 [Thelohanellus kitauei]|uniref:Uncharacterized protein n=1 Tax=Thelohanellus kitauei TaxID=669202 RepID=A0A0C2N8X8_THEKT|nr:hypothetical protein RF11_02169 [Thelohanellus kitauei]
MKTRQYAQKSIFDLEAIFEQSSNNASELEQLLSELTFRNTARARTLTAKIEQCVVAISASSPSTHHPDSVSIQSSRVVPHNSPAAEEQLQLKAIPDSAIREQFDKDQIDLGPIPSFSPSGKANDARAILAAWTALEALSPQAYKRPEDMATGDRSRVALLERGVPWGPNARSKPSYKLYFEVVLSRSSSAPSLSTRRRTSWSRFLARMRSVHARTVRKRPSARS